MIDYLFINIFQNEQMEVVEDVLVIDLIADVAGGELPWELFFANDLAIRSHSAKEVEMRAQRWEKAFRDAGLRVNIGTTEYMVINGQNEEDGASQVVINGQALKRVLTFKYLGTVVDETAGYEKTAAARISAALPKWRTLSGVMCDKQMPKTLKGKVYKLSGHL